MNKPIHRTFSLLFLLIALCLGVVSCSDDEPTPEPTVAAAPASTATAEPTQPTSPLNAASDSPLPTPTSVTSTSTSENDAKVISIPAAAPVEATTTITTGAATGRIFLINDQDARPVTGVIVALAAVITGEDGDERAAGYDPSTAPRNDITNDGIFVIENVPPGRYGVILDSVMTAVLLKEPDNLENSLVITVEADKVTDLGTLVYSTLPLPNMN